jgi:tetratricopeptide (TPR) repeat protein
VIRAACLIAFLAVPPQPAEIDVQLKTVDGEVMCSVHTRGATPADVLAEVARKSERVLVGLDGVAPGEAIPVWLDERPLRHVVQTIAACAGWRAHVNIARIELDPDLDGGDAREALEDQCFAATLRAIRAHPEHPLAAEGEMVLGEIRERRGDLRAAESHYSAVAKHFEKSALAADALLRSGRIFERLGDWIAALEQFRALANLPQEHPYQARARLEIAHCMAENDDGRQALFVLDTLEKLFPTTLTSERQSRLYVRARALLASQREKEAARALASADELGRNEEWDSDAMELRAQVLARFGRHSESARAWLAYSQNAESQARLRAWVNAAQEAREAGDVLGVLCVQHLARGTRAEGALEAIAEEARKDIGLSGGDENSLGGDLVAQARALIEQQKGARALALLAPLYQRREERQADARLELVTLYARALAGEKGVDAAVAELRRNLDAFAEPAARKQLCSTAGELYETAERFDDAIRAYGGQL